MNLNIYAVYDKAVSAYMRPFVMRTDGEAMRMFQQEATSAESSVSRAPEDYALFRLGSFTDSDGAIEPCEPKCLARAHELVAVIKKEQLDG